LETTTAYSAPAPAAPAPVQSYSAPAPAAPAPVHEAYSAPAALAPKSSGY
jgi:hypothetical protein